MTDAAYKYRRGELETYFGDTAADKWVALTSNGPVSAIRATVRAGRDAMRNTLLSWLPDDLSGARVLDAGCGTGMFAVEAARRGADVTAIDLSQALIDVAQERSAGNDTSDSISYHCGDMTDPAFGRFDYVVSMDSIIHYALPNALTLLEGFAARTDKALLFTFAPKTPMLTVMHAAGQLFPRDNRSPAIVPISQKRLEKAISTSDALSGFRIERSNKISSAFYKSQAMELRVK
ncbi:MAG: magnesium protoporphyrin IX methyltransferase [Pseudomonadota bacterium]